MARRFPLAYCQYLNAHEEDRACVVLRGSVYDVRDFIEQHPGGGAILVDVINTDATVEFSSVAHSDAALRIMDALTVWSYPKAMGKEGITWKTLNDDERARTAMESIHWLSYRHRISMDDARSFLHESFPSWLLWLLDLCQAFFLSILRLCNQPIWFQNDPNRDRHYYFHHEHP